jgi:hypothetical protein
MRQLVGLVGLQTSHMILCDIERTQYGPEAVVARCDDECIVCGSSHRGGGSSRATHGD